MACGGAVLRWGGLRGGGVGREHGGFRLAGRKRQSFGARDGCIDERLQSHALPLTAQHAVQVVVAHLVLARKCRLGLLEARHGGLEALPSVEIGCHVL